MREFHFINENEEIFDLMGKESDFLNEPSGLGYKYNNEYTRLNLIQAKTGINFEFPKVSGEILLKNYDYYSTLMNYIHKSKKLKLMYRPSQSIGIFYLEGEVISIAKSEISVDTGLLHCNMEFQGEGLWQREARVMYNIVEEASSEYYPYTYPNTYGIGGGSKEITIPLRNEGHTEAPTKIIITGLAENPEWRLEGHDGQSGGMNMTIQKGSSISIDSRESEYKISGDGEIILDKFKKHELKNYIHIPVGVSNLKVKNAEGAEVVYYEQFLSV